MMAIDAPRFIVMRRGLERKHSQKQSVSDTPELFDILAVARVGNSLTYAGRCNLPDENTCPTDLGYSR